MIWMVSDVMTREVVTVGPAMPFKKCIDLMRIHGVSALPVVAGGGLIGIVSESDLMRKAAAAPDMPGDPVAEPTGKGAGMTVGDVMTTDVATINASASVASAARLMYARRVSRLPVLDHSRRLVGIVSRADVLKMFLRSDESIRKEVFGLLNELPLLGRGRLRVDVRDGVVGLFGETESGSLTGLLVRLVKAVPGVVAVENQVRPALVQEEALSSTPASTVSSRRG